MPYRAMALVAASFLFATQSCAEPTTHGSRSNGSEKTQTKQPGGTARVTVTGSGTQAKRMGGGGGGKGAAGVTTVKSNKSNTSDGIGADITGRMGAGGAGKGAVQLNPQPEPPGRR
jgi:hypothetical protein